MVITQTVTKKILETIVQKTFSNFGNLSCSSLLDSLKLLGFYYATNAGISINIEDLKTPNVKKEFLNQANDEMMFISEQWQQGNVSDTERFQTIIDSWNIATETLKNRIVDYYENFDPANNLYIMAFSGARGNMSQVRQLVGMRGLMSDQEGKIIDLPIQANFREGLSSIDYIISSYGARKGIVDTALKTADSGYLTRRLIYIAQDLVIREIDCFTTSGVIVLVNEKSTAKNIIGRTVISMKEINKEHVLEEKDFILTTENFKKLKKVVPLFLNLRSVLTCKSNGSICQKCYGWDLAHNKMVSLGEAVGIIAAQSIGEPGTQLTMRTFHTGGIFTSESVKQITAPYSGKISIPDSLKTIPYRTNHGNLVSRLQQETIITIINWKGQKEEIFLEIGSFLYIKSSSFVKKGQLISEYSGQSIVSGARRLKPIYTTTMGEVWFENLILLNTFREKRLIRLTHDDGIVWIAEGKVFPFPKEIQFHFPKELNKRKAFASLRLVTPIEGILSHSNKSIIVENAFEKLEFNFSNFLKKFPNCETKISIYIKNYQYIDTHTVIASLDLFPIKDSKIYSVKKKDSTTKATYFLITEDEIWKINADQVANFTIENNKKGLIRSGNLVNKTSQINKSGFFLKKDGMKIIFQNAFPMFLSLGTIINYKKDDFVLKNQLFATLINYTQQTEDIVQGLPKIEELIEARKPKVKAFLSSRPGVLISSDISSSDRTLNQGICTCIIEKSNLLLEKEEKKGKVYLQVIHSLFIRGNLYLYEDKLVQLTKIPKIFQPELRRDIQYPLDYHFYDKRGEILLLNGKKQNSVWVETDSNSDSSSCIYQIVDKNFYSSKTKLKSRKYKNKKVAYKDSYTIVETEDNEYYLLEYLNPLTVYQVSESSGILFNSGNFVDIGEPITEGIIDIHELLGLLFKYHSIIDGTMFGTIRSLNKFQLLLVNSIQSIYQSQNVNISSKHIEIIVRQMTSKIAITESGDTPLIPGEIVRISLMLQISLALKERKYIKSPKYEPLLLSTTNSSLSKDGFLSAAGFQETKRVLTKAALEGTTDWLRGLKECVIIGRLIPAGSAFLNYKNYLDNIYLFKD
jgi:hypothetical protein